MRGAVNWLKKLAKKATGRGTITESGSTITMTISNDVPHASKALNDRLMYDVKGKIERRIGQAIKTQLAAMARRLARN